MRYQDLQKLRAAAWKKLTTTIPSEAKETAEYVGKTGEEGVVRYEFCLPRKHAALNLLPEVRDSALSLFSELEIAWHASVDGGPTNHLVSSQVQCVNALGLMVHHPERLVAAFGELLGIDEVLHIEPGRFLTFEYIGSEDYFGEGVRGRRTRGSQCTSVDAAFLHRADDGANELVLLEWKYTESCPTRPRDDAKLATRRCRYEAAVNDPSGPIRSGVVPFEDLLDEPFYQLVRQQLLAYALEVNGAEGADRVRVVHVSPCANEAYQASLPRRSHEALGSSVSEVWAKLLRHPDWFTSVESAMFLEPAVTYGEYHLRYDPDTVLDGATLLLALEASDAGGVADKIDFDGDVLLWDDGVELVLDGIGTKLEYPFHLDQLCELSGEIDPG